MEWGRSVTGRVEAREARDPGAELGQPRRGHVLGLGDAQLRVKLERRAGRHRQLPVFEATGQPLELFAQFGHLEQHPASVERIEHQQVEI